jgi:hypothetical protein
MGIDHGIADIHVAGATGVGEETRPKNYAVHWIIRIK